MYGNYMPQTPNTYPAYQNPYQARLDALSQPQMQAPQHYDIITVNGENGARAFRMAPNSRCLLLDETNPVVWLAQSDGAGYMTYSPYSITPYQAQPQASPVDALAEKVARLEAVVYGKSDPANAQQTAQQPAGGPTASE